MTQPTAAPASLTAACNPPPNKGKRILLAWEHGHNLGHISRLLAAASLIKAQGGEPVFALPPAFIQAPQFGSLPYARFASPIVRQPIAKPASRIDSFADILISVGFADALALGQALSAWAQLFEATQPDSVLLDYAPTAQLAAQLLRLPAHQITNGFDAPPANCPVFGITVRGPYLDQLNVRKREQVNVAMARAAQIATGEPGPDLDAYFNYPTRAYDCIAETDPYGPREQGTRREDLYLGPLSTVGFAQNACRPGTAAIPLFPANAGSRRSLFAYLRNVPEPEEWLNAMCQIDANTLCVWPDIPQELMKHHCNPRVRITQQPVDMGQALAQADGVLNYGSTTTVCQSLLAGRPQLMVPADIEKTMVSRRVAAQDAGLLWQRSTGTRTDALEQLLNDHVLAQAACGIARKYPVEQLQRNQLLFARAMTGNSQFQKEKN